MGLELLTLRVDSLVGQAHDKYLRTAVEIGPYIHVDGRGDPDAALRMVLGYGVRGRWENTNMDVNGNNLSGSTWSIEFPIAFGLGAKRVFVEDQIKLMVEFSPSFKMKNEATLSYRPYANLNNMFIQTVDLFVSHVYELGKVSNEIKERSSLVMAGLSLGLFNYSLDIKTD